MTIKLHLLLMIGCTLLSAGGFILVLFFINPETTNTIGFTLFYASLFFASAGILSLLSYGLRYIFTRRYSRAEKVEISFRQAIFFATVIVVALLLQSNQLLNWLNTVMLVAMVTLIEFFVLSLNRKVEKKEVEGRG